MELQSSMDAVQSLPRCPPSPPSPLGAAAEAKVRTSTSKLMTGFVRAFGRMLLPSAYGAMPFSMEGATPPPSPGGGSSEANSEASLYCRIFSSEAVEFHSPTSATSRAGLLVSGPTPTAPEMSSLRSSKKATGKPYISVTLAESRCLPEAMARDVWVFDDFIIKEAVYEGYASKVYRAVDKQSGTVVAMKVYNRRNMNAFDRVQVIREVRLHSLVYHSSIIDLYAAWKDPSYVYLALEWAPMGDLFRHLNQQRLQEDQCVLILRPILQGVAMMHEQGIIHRDIKPENILLSDAGKVKISDFGLSIDHQEICNTKLGTYEYMAPEILDCPGKTLPDEGKEAEYSLYTNKVDCWSLGVLTYEMLVGFTPFRGDDAAETFNNIKLKDVVYPMHLSDDAVAFISQAIERDPEKRLSVQQLLDHPWIVKLDYLRGREPKPFPRRVARSLHNPPPWSEDGTGSPTSQGDQGKKVGCMGVPSPLHPSQSCAKPFRSLSEMHSRTYEKSGKKPM